LEDFQKDAGLTQFIDVGDGTPQRLAKLAGFVSKSVSSQSQAIGSGSVSQPVTF
jgi:stage V sporulation protein SpoVS